eukprot:TRINITY_DN43891_c0_g1_i4.p1 TRINITY_DN43891_c0_g1~~TRINITY_DN43891_c0_g1_i4.p1  ORF type:complete len:576 (+),score=79.77 TRINITY_DN43891_c0_g1_i4:183-1910(+)
MTYAFKHYHFKLLLKCDTDSYVFLDRLLTELETNDAFNMSRRLYMGNFAEGTGSKVVTSDRAHAGKAGWTKIDEKMTKWLDDSFYELTGLDSYPVHAKGPGYLLSHSLVEHLTSAPVGFKPFTCEDTAVGSYLVATDHERIPLQVRLDPSGCRTEKAVIDHYVKPYTMRIRWRRLELLADACLAPQMPATHQAQGACLSVNASMPVWRIARGVLGPVVFGHEQVNDTFAADHHTTRCKTCDLRFKWKASRWGACQPTCDGGEQWRCLQCVGSDGETYDDWECAYAEMPHRSVGCMPQLKQPCGALYNIQVAHCEAVASRLPVEKARSGLPKALWLAKQILDMLRLPFVLDPSLVAQGWEKTCALPNSTELTVFVMHRYVYADTLLLFEKAAQNLGMASMMNARHTMADVGFMLILSCPAKLCGTEVFLQVKVAEEVEDGIWWPRWDWVQSNDQKKAPDDRETDNASGSLAMQLCRSSKPTSFQIAVVEHVRYLVGRWPPGAELICYDNFTEADVSFRTVWKNKDNVLDAYLRVASGEALASLGLSRPPGVEEELEAEAAQAAADVKLLKQQASSL